MILLQTIQATLSGWKIPDLIASTPSWAKNLSQTIKDSRAYQAVSNNSRTISYLVGITGTIYAIEFIARVYLKTQKIQEELQKKLTQLETDFNTEKTTHQETKSKLTNLQREHENDLKALEHEKHQLAEKLKKAEIELNTRKTNLQEKEKEIANMPKQNKALQQEKHKSTEQFQYAQDKLTTNPQVPNINPEKNSPGITQFFSNNTNKTQNLFTSPTVRLKLTQDQNSFKIPQGHPSNRLTNQPLWGSTTIAGSKMLTRSMTPSTLEFNLKQEERKEQISITSDY